MLSKNSCALFHSKRKVNCQLSMFLFESVMPDFLFFYCSQIYALFEVFLVIIRLDFLVDWGNQWILRELVGSISENMHLEQYRFLSFLPLYYHNYFIVEMYKGIYLGSELYLPEVLFFFMNYREVRVWSTV